MMRCTADSCLTTRPGCTITTKLALPRRDQYAFLRHESLTQRLLDVAGTVSLGGGLRGETSPTRTVGAVMGHLRRAKTGQLWAEASELSRADG